MTDPHCNNCQTPLPDGAAFCHSCGQSVRTFERPWLEVFRELGAELFDFDGRMLSSLKLLLTRPGFLSYEYIHGRRVSYTSPARMYLAVSVLFFLVLPMIVPPNPEGLSTDHQLSVDLYSKAMFVLLPLFALLLKLFYRPFWYLAHLVFAAYLFSVMFIGFALTMVFESAADRHWVFMIVQTVIMIAMLTYAVMALRKTYGGTWPMTTLKFFGLLVTFLPFLALAIELASHTAG